MSELPQTVLEPRIAGTPRRSFRPIEPASTSLSEGSGGEVQPPLIQPHSTLPFFSGSDSSGFPGPLEAGFIYTGGNRAEFYRFLRDRLPVVSAGIWSWVHLCATPLERHITGIAYAIRDAEKQLNSLDNRILPYPGRLALDRLTEALFWELFTLGRCAAEIIPLPDLSGLAEIRFLDPFRIRLGAKSNQYYYDTGNKLIAIVPERFFYAVLQNDPAQPLGIEPLATLPFVLAIENQLLEDMARSSHNVGSPRLQVKITPPTREPSESGEEYETRAGRYFDDTVSGFAKLDPDDNLFTWNDVEVTVIGGESGQRSTWRLNRQEVIEDVVTGLKLFPWVLGRSHGTTKNWVETQFNLLMHIVGTLQLRGLQLAERIANTELALRGNPATVTYSYTPHVDPFALQREQAFSLRAATLMKLVDGGYLKKEDVKEKLGHGR